MSKEGADTIRSLVSTRNLQLQCRRVLHLALLVPVVMCGSETQVRREKERPRIRTEQMGNLRIFAGY